MYQYKFEVDLLFLCEAVLWSAAVREQPDGSTTSGANSSWSRDQMKRLEEDALLVFDRRVLPPHAVNVFKVAGDGRDRQQNGARGVDSQDHFAVPRLNAHVLVLGEDLRDVAGGLAEPPARGRSDHEAPGAADLLLVQNRDGQPLL